MKKLLLLFLLLVMVVPALADAPLENDMTAYVITDVPGERLNLRTTPSVTAGSRGKYYAGVQVERLGESNNGFSLVRIGETEGWMKESFLSGTKLTDEIPTCNVSNSKGTGANLRTKANKVTGKVIRLFPNGTTVKVLGVLDSGWLHVEVEGYIGFMQDDLVNLKLSFADKVVQEYTEPGSMYISTGHKDTHATVYAQPDQQSEAVAEFFSGSMVIVQRFAEDGWAYIWDGSVEGWLQSAFLVPITDKPVVGILDAAMVSADGSVMAGIYSKPETGAVIHYDPDGTIFHVKALLPRGWAYGWSDDVPQGGFIRAENMLEPRYMTDWMYVINDDPAHRLNLRAEPSRKAESLAKFGNGMRVMVTAYNADRSWAKVVAGDLTGWMDMSYLTYEYYDAELTKIKVIRQVESVASPEGKSWSPGTLQTGTMVSILGVHSDGWVYVGFEDSFGWNCGWVPANALAQ